MSCKLYNYNIQKFLKPNKILQVLKIFENIYVTIIYSAESSSIGLSDPSAKFTLTLPYFSSNADVIAFHSLLKTTNNKTMI